MMAGGRGFIRGWLSCRDGCGWGGTLRGSGRSCGLSGVNWGLRYWELWIRAILGWNEAALEIRATCVLFG